MAASRASRQGSCVTRGGCGTARAPAVRANTNPVACTGGSAARSPLAPPAPPSRVNGHAERAPEPGAGSCARLRREGSLLLLEVGRAA
ncbi:Unconventional myosin-If [Manis javanica]|nr:Unconventional myosin-If [Manis javanica]